MAEGIIGQAAANRHVFPRRFCRKLQHRYHVAVDGDYGPKRRQVVTSFQMHAIVADGIAGAQTEAKLLSDLDNLRKIRAHRAEPA